MENYSTQAMPYYPSSRSGRIKRAIGMTMTGGLIGMTAYYTPVKKDSFVQQAFDVTKKDADEKIVALRGIAQEVEQNNLSTQSKMVLQDMGLAEDVVEITNKCSEIDKKVTDSVSVKALKDDFSRNFDSYKKNSALMDNTCAEAFRAIKRSKFAWGVGVGSAIGLALSLLASKD
ncbi:MAG: hypothetical protein NC390_05555 [Fusobacterium sp.]|nr:hypothetical protein [Fusobacterium sp.]